MPERRHRAGGEYAIPPIALDEPDRLAALERYDVLDTPAEQAYDDLTLLASYICGTGMALISLVDEGRQWFKSRVGLELRQTERDVAFCAHAIAGRDTMIVTDALKDHRFAFNPLVQEDPEIRFYAGAPLRTADGHALGTLCVLDRKPHQLSAEQLRALEALSRQVMAQLELRRQLAEVKRMAGLMPYCAVCGKLRTDLGDRCPDCMGA